MAIRAVAAGSAGLLWWLGGCAGPAARAPGAVGSLALPARYDATPYPVPAISDSLLGLFDDAGLRAVVGRAMSNNPDLRRSLARLEEAGFNARKAGASQWPELDATADAARIGTPGARTTSRLSATLDVRWELDVWGRIRAGVVAAAADAAAAAADHEAARQSLAAQTMQAWFEWVAAGMLVDLGERRTASFESTRQLLARRFELGAGSLSDLELARADLENARADLAQRLDNRDRIARLLRALEGEYPAARGAPPRRWPSLDRGVAAGIPSDLLRQRPDVDAAYQRIRAADSRVKVAHAELFPRFPLTAAGGRASNRLADLSRSATDAWSVAAALSAPLFDAGERRAELGAAGKRAEQALEAWRATVIEACREVEDALGAESRLRAQERARAAALEAARSASDKARRDYEAGIGNALSLLLAQRLVFGTEEQTIQLHAARLQNRVRLALALGKGV